MTQRISKHFTRDEFTCHCGCGYNTVDTELMDLLENLRVSLDAPIVINSGCRCQSHNQAVGGSKGSQHLLGRAADFVVIGYDPIEVYKYLDHVYPTSYGMGCYDNFIHLDSREGKARWGHNPD